MSEKNFDAVRALVNSIRAKADLEPISSPGDEDEQLIPKCEKCGGTGWKSLGRDRDGYSWVTACDCMAIANSKRRIKESGLSEILANCTFDSFQTKEPYQQQMARTAAAFVEAVKAGEKPWFFIGGQPGCGKTHICTAICGKLLDAGKDVRYMQWISETRALKANTTDYQAFKALILPSMTCSVLYIDDLFKGVQGAKPTPADGTTAFEILNSRSNQGKITIVSSEWTLAQLLDFDQATFSRLKQRANGYILNIGADETRNYRLTC